MQANQEPNPYSAPASESVIDPTVSLDFLPIMWRWERLRLYYNGVLVIYVLLIAITIFPAKARDLSFWFCVCLGGVLANVCYLTGPTIEAYATYFRVWNKTLTMLLFAAGLGFTALLATVCIATF